MNWIDLKIIVPQAWADVAEAIAVGISGSGVYIEDYADLEQEAPNIAPVDFIDETLLLKSKDEVVIHLYLPPEEDIFEIKELLTGRLHAASASYILEENVVQQEDWENSWKAHYHAVPIGEKLLICPAWETVDADETRHILHLDPGMAFGTGTHETTALCLTALDELVQEGDRVLDIGCGSGILGIGACLLGAGEVDGIDIDPVAVRTARENALLNGVENTFHVKQGDLVSMASGTYNIVVSNIVANAIITLAPAVPELLAKDGIFISSGIITEREQDVVDELTASGLQVLEIRRKNNWVCILAKHSS